MDLVAPSMDDVDAVADLWVDLARGQRSYGSHIRPEASRSAVRESVARHVVTGGVLVARDDAVVGFVTFSRETGGYDTDCERGVVENLYVVPERRGEGIGSELLAAAEDALFDAGVDAIALEAMAENEAARRFYARHGYEPHRVELEKSAESDTDSKVDG